MKAWICNSCGARIKQENKPIKCMLCNRRSEFSQHEIKETKDGASEKYNEALKKLEEYEEGVPKRKLSDYSCAIPKKKEEK